MLQWPLLRLLRLLRPPNITAADFTAAVTRRAPAVEYLCRLRLQREAGDGLYAIHAPADHRRALGTHVRLESVTDGYMRSTLQLIIVAPSERTFAWSRLQTVTCDQRSS